MCVCVCVCVCVCICVCMGAQMSEAQTCVCVNEPQGPCQQNANGEGSKCNSNHGSRVKAFNDDALLGLTFTFGGLRPCVVVAWLGGLCRVGVCNKDGTH